ncbi:MAG: hypothetical protein WCK47_11890 [bacterium]|nr:hypothetical protein [Candidatus Sumerlaeota bacterium]
MTDSTDISVILKDIIDELLRKYDDCVTEHGAFPDLKAGRRAHFDDPLTTLPGWLELAVMSMNSHDEPHFITQRFLSVRVVKSRKQGFVSLSCNHGFKQELRNSLQTLATDPEPLVERILELADGLPEETAPDIWR